MLWMLIRYNIVHKVQVSIHLCISKAWCSVDNESRVATHQQDSHSLEQVLDLLVNILPCVAGQLPSKPGDECCRILMPATQGFHQHWVELDTVI